MQLRDHKNILLNQILVDNSSFSFKECIPSFNSNNKFPLYLSINKNNDISWLSIDYSLNIIVNNRIKDTNIYYADGRVGLGRYPLFNYKVDIAVPKNTLMTAFHVGDGSYGFSLGNGTTDGFLPEIIGISSKENDAGLYFVGIPGNDKISNIPLIAIDGRSFFGDRLCNRPIFGVTSADYYNYDLLLDASSNLKVRGNISVYDVILNNVSLIKIIKGLQEQINELKAKIT